MRAVAPAVLRARVLQLDADGKLPALPPSRQDPKGSTLSAVRSLAWGSQFLGVDLPAIYLDEERSQPFAAPFAKHQTTVIGKGALQGRSVGELAFLVGRHLALRIPEHELVVHLGSIDELSVCFHAAVKLVLGTTMATGPLAQVVDALAGALGSQQSDEERAALEVAVKQFAEGEARVNLNHWVSGVERCVTRAGLLLCGDLPTAVAVIRAEGDTAFATVDARIDDLCSFAVSGSHVKLRQELGSGLTGTDALPPLTVRG
jgi:hypothetical protein